MIDWSKPVQTRDGREVKIYSRDNGGRYTIHGAVKNAGVWESISWTDCGRNCASMDNTPSDLVNIPRRVKVDFWMNVYEDGSIGCPCSSREIADDLGQTASTKGRNRHACIHIVQQVEEGDGL